MTAPVLPQWQPTRADLVRRLAGATYDARRANEDAAAAPADMRLLTVAARCEVARDVAAGALAACDAGTP